MKIVVFGGNEENLGGVLSSGLENCLSLSRRTKPSLDVIDPYSVDVTIERERPEAIIFAAIMYPELKCLGTIKDWEDINALLDTKIKGCYIVLNAAINYGVKHFIVMAGSAVSKDPQLCHFTIVNSALWGMIQFATQHTFLDAYYLEMGVVLPSRIGEQYLGALSLEQQIGVRAAAITPCAIVQSVKSIFAGHYSRGARVVLNKGGV
jgi:hypothetical protein